MSKFIDAIQHKLTGTRTIEIPRLLVKIKQQVNMDSAKVLDEYRISVNYGMYINCTAKELPNAIKNIVEQLRDEIYGEFLHDLHELVSSIYNQDRETSLEICKKLLAEMTGR